MNIMLVDDSKTMRNVQRRMLETMGPVTFTEAGDGEEALAIFIGATAPYDCIIIDWNMPKMDGITLVRNIREHDKSTRLIIATTEVEKSRVMEALKAGVNNDIIKPFTPEAFVDKIRQTFAKRAAV